MSYLKRSDRKTQILTVAYQAWLQGKRLTTHDIADRVGLKPSQHLRNMINELVLEQCLYAAPVQHRPHVQKFVYTFAKRGVNYHHPVLMSNLENIFGKQLELPL